MMSSEDMNHRCGNDIRLNTFPAIFSALRESFVGSDLLTFALSRILLFVIFGLFQSRRWASDAVAHWVYFLWYQKRMPFAECFWTSGLFRFTLDKYKSLILRWFGPRPRLLNFYFFFTADSGCMFLPPVRPGHSNLRDQHPDMQP